MMTYIHDAAISSLAPYRMNCYFGVNSGDSVAGTRGGYGYGTKESLDDLVEIVCVKEYDIPEYIPIITRNVYCYDDTWMI